MHRTALQSNASEKARTAGLVAHVQKCWAMASQYTVVSPPGPYEGWVKNGVVVNIGHDVVVNISVLGRGRRTASTF